MSSDDFREDIRFVGELVQGAWLQFRSCPALVAFEGAFVGAILDAIEDECAVGHLDLSHAGRQKLFIHAVGVGLASVRILYRPAPGSTPTK